MVHVLLEELPQHLDLLLPVLEAFDRFRHPKLDGPCGVTHVVDDHVHEDSVDVYLRA